MNYLKFMDSKSLKGQEGVHEIEGVMEGEEGVPEGRPNFEEEFCATLE